MLMFSTIAVYWKRQLLYHTFSKLSILFLFLCFLRFEFGKQRTSLHFVKTTKNGKCIFGRPLQSEKRLRRHPYMLSLEQQQRIFTIYQGFTMNQIIKKLFKKTSAQAKQRPYSWTAISIGIVFLLIPFFIWFSYLIGKKGHCLIYTSISLEEALDLYGVFISNAGTVALGLIAVWQNTRLQKIEEGVLARDNSCNIYIKKHTQSKRVPHWLSHDGATPYESSGMHICFHIANYSEAFLKEIEIDFGETIFHSNITLIKDNPKVFNISLPKNFASETRCKIIFTSCYGVQTYGDFEVGLNGSISKLMHYHFYGIQKPN